MHPQGEDRGRGRAGGWLPCRGPALGSGQTAQKVPQAHAGIHGDTFTSMLHSHTRTTIRSRTQHHSRTARARRPADDTWTQGQHSGHLPHGGSLSHQVCPDTGVSAGGGDVTACQPREAGQSWVLRQGGGRAGVAGWSTVSPEIPCWPGPVVHLLLLVEVVRRPAPLPCAASCRRHRVITPRARTRTNSVFRRSRSRGRRR